MMSSPTLVDVQVVVHSVNRLLSAERCWVVANRDAAAGEQIVVSLLFAFRLSFLIMLLESSRTHPDLTESGIGYRA